MSLQRLVVNSVNAYASNFKLISLFSIPFLVSFPLALLLPNFIAVSGVFLRFDSIIYDLTVESAAMITAALLVSLALFSFAISAVNVIVRHQRTLNRVTSIDFEVIEKSTYKLFFVFLTVFILTLFANFALLEYAAPSFHWLATLFTLIVSFAVLFAPQAIILEEVPLFEALKRGAAVMYTRFQYVVFYVCLASILLLSNAYLFLVLQNSFGWAVYAGVAVNAMILTPFLEVMKAQIFLYKYPLIGR
ncbi:MAG: hypothetical protein WC607_03830 [Candidatus Micrarchaeia archaeon]